LNTARESIILIKNENSVLPLDEKKLTSLAVIGDNSERLHSNGGGSAEIKALYEISPLMGLKMKLGGNMKINFARGYSEVEEDREMLLLEAVEAAKNADAVVVVGGLNHSFDTEGADRKDLKLPYGQDELINKILGVNKNTAVVILSGSPVEMEQWIDKAPAVVQSWYAGMEGGLALAEVLLGEVNPSGKLPVTFPKTLEASPAHKLGEFPGNSDVKYNEGLLAGYRYFTTRNIEPLFCFGHGLSYTSFEYSDLNIYKEADEEETRIRVSFNITNTGDREGAEAAQLYVRDMTSSVERPAFELKGFKKIFLKSGEKKLVDIILDKTSLAFYNEVKKAWLAEAGEFEALVGSSCGDIRLAGKFIIEKDIIF
jgi:beta-glucosidase